MRKTLVVMVLLICTAAYTRSANVRNYPKLIIGKWTNDMFVRRYTKNGTFSHSAYDELVTKGKYKIKNNVLIEQHNNGMDEKYTTEKLDNNSLILFHISSKTRLKYKRVR